MKERSLMAVFRAHPCHEQLTASARRDTDPINGSIVLSFFSNMKILLDPVVTTGITLLMLKPDTQIELAGSNFHGNLW